MSIKNRVIKSIFQALAIFGGITLEFYKSSLEFLIGWY